MKFYSEKFKGKPAYTLILVNDLLKLTFVSLSVLVGFNLIILISRNHEAITNLQPPSAPDPIFIYNDRTSQAIERFNSEINLNFSAEENNSTATDIYFKIFGENLRDRPFNGVIFRANGFDVWCGESAGPRTLGCHVGKRG